MERPDSVPSRQLLISQSGRRQSAFCQLHSNSVHSGVDGLDTLEMGLYDFAA
jgi:hypothetical protein